MKTRKLALITKDLNSLSPADAHTVASVAYQLRHVRLSDATEAERAFARLLRDIAAGAGDDVRMAHIRSDR